MTFKTTQNHFCKNCDSLLRVERVLKDYPLECLKCDENIFYFEVGRTVIVTRKIRTKKAK